VNLPASMLSATAGRVRRELADPEHRNGYALAAGVLITAGFGVLFWIVAAVVTTPEEFSTDSSAVWTIVAISTIGQLGLNEVLARRMPRLRRAGPTLARAFAMAGAATAAVGVAAVTVGERVPAISTGLLDDGAMVVTIVVGAVLWSLFTIQDGALAGQRRGTWTVPENATYSVLRIVVLLAAEVLGVPHAIVIAWLVPLPAIIAVIVTLLVREHRPLGEPTDLTAAQQATQTADYIGSITSTGLMLGLPVVVLAMGGTTSAEAFAVPFVFASTVYLLATSMSMSLAVEGSVGAVAMAQLTRRNILRSGCLVAPIALVAVIAPGLVLAPFGGAADGAATVMRILMVSAVLRVVVSAGLAVARVHGHWQQLLGVQLALGAVAVGVIVLDPFAATPATRVAVGWLFANAVVAVPTWQLVRDTIGRPTARTSRGSVLGDGDAAHADDADGGHRPFTEARP
jgi:hypothetical protein